MDQAALFSSISALRNPPMIIGGFARHLLYGDSYSDIDLLALNEASVEETINLFKNFQIFCSLDRIYLYFKIGKESVQLQFDSNIRSVDDFLNWSDFTVCAIAISGNKVFKHSLFDRDFKNKHLRINKTHVQTPYMLERIKKYEAKGFKFIGYDDDLDNSI